MAMNTSVSLSPYTGEIGLNKIEGVVRFCPYPLVAAPEDEDTTIYVNYGSCAVPCPSIVFVADEWERTVSVLHVLGLVSVLLSFLVLLGHLCHYNSKKYIRTMFIGGFCASSVVLCVFLLANTGSSITCNSEAHYVEKAPLCVLQAFCLVFCFTWVVTWSVIFSLDVYNHISSVSPDYDSSRHHRKYTTIALLISFAVAIIPFVADNLGFDPEANIPICFFLFSQDSTYFWFLFYGPVWLLVVACTAITLAAMARIQTIYINSREYDRMRAKMRRKGGGRKRGNAGGRRITDRYNSNVSGSGSGGGSFQHRQHLASLASSYNSRGEGGQQYLYEPPRGAAAGGTQHAVAMAYSADSALEQQQRQQQAPMSRSAGNRGPQHRVGSNPNSRAAPWAPHLQHSDLYFDDDRDFLSAVDENGELEWSVSDGAGSKHSSQLTAAQGAARSSQSVSSRNTAATASASASASAVAHTHSPPIPIAQADAAAVSHPAARDAGGSGSGSGLDDEEEDAEGGGDDDNDNHDNIYNSGGTASGGGERLLSTASGLWSTTSGDRRTTPQGGDDEDDDDSFAEGARPSADKNSGAGRADNDSPSVPLLGGKSSGGKASKSTRVTPPPGRDVGAGSSAGAFVSASQSAPDDPPSSWITWILTRSGKSHKGDGMSAKNLNEQQKMSASSVEPPLKGASTGAMWRHQAARRSPVSRATSNATDTTYSQRDSDLTAGSTAVSDSALSVTASTLYSTWRDNGKSIIFVLIFCITTLYVAPVLLYIYYIDYDTTKDATVDFVECLVMAATNCTAPAGTMLTQDTVDDCAAAACGPHPHPRPNRPLLMSVLLWMGALGILPSIIFGFTGGGGEATDEDDDEHAGANVNSFPQHDVFDLSGGSSGAHGKLPYQPLQHPPHPPHQLYHR